MTLLAGFTVAAVLLLASPATAQATEGPDDPLKDGVEYEWWDESWHMRVPVLVRPQMPDTVVDGRRPVIEDVENVPVHVEIDYTDVIRQVGDSPDKKWPQRVDGSLNSFTFDKDSVRVVRYDRDTGTVKDNPETDDVVPSRFVPSLLERRDLKNGRFDPSANAVGTATWVAEGDLADPRLYFVYFDILENGDKPPQDFPPKEEASLDSLYWQRPGTDAYGYVPESSAGSEGDRPAVEVYGLYEDTAVRFERYTQSGFDPAPVDSCEDTSSGLCVDGGEKLDETEEPTFELQRLDQSPENRRLQVNSPQDLGYFFHVEADKPVLVAVRSPNPPACPTSTFYPGFSGVVSEQFAFTHLNDPASSGCQASDQLGLRFIAPRDAASVTFQYLDTGQTESFTVPSRGSHSMELPDGAAGRPVFVDASEPIAIAQPGAIGQEGMQLPDPYGSPVGTRTMGPVTNDVWAVPWENTSTVTSFDINNPGQEDATLSGTGGPGAGNAIHLGLDGAEFNDYRGNVWSSTTDDGSEPLSVFHGLNGLVPVGGEDGRRFQVPVGDDEQKSIVDEQQRMVLFPVYDRTELQVTQNATDTEVFNDTVGQHRFLDDDGTTGEDRFPAPGGYSVEASKPMLAYQVSANSGSYGSYYPTVSTSPLYEVGDGEFYGNLIRWDKPLRTPTMAPGQEQRFTLDLTNLGREIGGENLADDIVIEQEVSGNGTVQLSTQQVRGLDTFDSREVTVAVEIPEDAETGDTLLVNLTAISQGNENFKAFTQLKITVETLFRVELSFRDNDCNPTTCERLVESGESTLYAVNVNNTGTGDDAYSFSVSESQSGFDAQIQSENGTVLATTDESLETISVARGEEKLVFLNVTAPDDASVAFPYEAVVQAISESDNKRDQVTALTRLSVNTDFRLEVDEESQTITPGENATFPITAVNEGDDTVLEITTSEPSLEGWNVDVQPESFLLRANGTTAPDGTPGDVRTANVTLTASDDARVGQILPLEITARSGSATDASGTESTEIRAVVANNFTLATSGLEPRSLQPGESFRYQFSVRNAANGPFTTTVNATGLPEGWRFEKDTPAEPRELAVGDTLDVAGDLVLPPGTPSGRYNVTFTFFGETDDGDRGVTNATGLVQVARRANLAIEPPSETTPVPPGNRTLVPLNVTNAGNVDLTAELGLSAPDDWSIEFRNRSQERLPLDAGESTTVDLIIGAPAEIGQDPVEYGVEADLPLRNPQTFTFQADWIRRDLSIKEAQPITDGFEPGAVNVLAVTVRNDGNLPANNVDLAVLVDGAAVSNTTLETLPPNQDRVVQIEWTADDVDGDLQVAIDPNDAFVETNEGNNAMGFAPTSESTVPGAHPLLAAVAAASLALIRRRWPR